MIAQVVISQQRNGSDFYCPYMLQAPCQDRRLPFARLTCPVAENPAFVLVRALYCFEVELRNTAPTFVFNFLLISHSSKFRITRLGLRFEQFKIYNYLSKK